jgi:uncharacterized protein YndB with AHSA1/START domain
MHSHGGTPLEITESIMEKRILKKEIVVPAPKVEVFKAWTTNEGVRAFFAPSSNIELKIGGAYEILFSLDAPKGSQGSEGMRILSYLPNEMLSFSWNAPPHLADVRKERKWVVLQFDAIDGGTTRVRFTEMGYGEGGEWDECYAYFDRAWGIVLSRLKERFESGPVDWNKL